jgi:hypothetical protein
MAMILASSPMKSILSLDLGTTTGWALRSRDGSIVSGSQSFKPQRFEGGGMRYLRFTRWLSEVAVTGNSNLFKDEVERVNDTLLDQIVFEEVRRHAGVDAAHAYGGFMSHLTSFAERHAIPYEGVPVGTIKKHATGKGNANKLMIITAMQALGHNPVDDNEADALALLRWAIERY